MKGYMHKNPLRSPKLVVYTHVRQRLYNQVQWYFRQELVAAQRIMILCRVQDGDRIVELNVE